MIRGGFFLSEEDRNKLIALAREGSVALARDATQQMPLVLLDDGWKLLGKSPMRFC